MYIVKSRIPKYKYNEIQTRHKKQQGLSNDPNPWVTATYNMGGDHTLSAGS